MVSLFPKFITTERMRLGRNRKQKATLGDIKEGNDSLQKKNCPTEKEKQPNKVGTPLVQAPAQALLAHRLKHSPAHRPSDCPGPHLMLLYKHKVQHSSEGGQGQRDSLPVKLQANNRVDGHRANRRRDQCRPLRR